MAKGKHATALFEVIHSGRSPKPSLSMRTPKWWFKRSNDAAAAVAAKAALEKVVVPESTAPSPRVPGVDLKFDLDRQQISFKLSYSSAMVAGFAVIVSVGLAYIVGSRMSHGPAPALAGPATEQIRQGPVRQNVLDLAPPNSSRGARRNPASQPSPARQPEARPTGPAIPTVASNFAPPASEPSTQRVMGLNYIIVQGYPAEEKALALAACELLKKNGIPCTVETNVPTYRSDWYIVIGLTGFDKPKTDPACAQYTARVNQLSDQFAADKSNGNSKFKRFAPRAQRWTGLSG